MYFLGVTRATILPMASSGKGGTLMIACCFVILATILILPDGEAQVGDNMVTLEAEVPAYLGPGRLRLAMSLDGSSVFVASDKESQINEFDTAARKLVQRIDTPLKDIRCLAVSPDRTMLAVAGDGLIVFRLEDKEVLFHRKQLGRVDSVVFSPNNKVLAVGTVDKVVKVMGVPDGKEWKSLTGSRGPVMCVSFSPEGSQIAAGGLDQAIRIWDVATGEEKRKIVNLVSISSALSYSEQGSYLAFAAIQAIGPVLDPLRLGALNEIKIWNLQANKEDSTIKGDMTNISVL
jgi:WD40 repeat protein